MPTYETHSVAGTTVKLRVFSVKSFQESDSGSTHYGLNDDSENALVQDRIEIVTFPDQKRHVFHTQRAFSRFIKSLIQNNREKIKSHNLNHHHTT